MCEASITRRMYWKRRRAVAMYVSTDSEKDVGWTSDSIQGLHVMLDLRLLFLAHSVRSTIVTVDKPKNQPHTTRHKPSLTQTNRETKKTSVEFPPINANPTPAKKSRLLYLPIQTLNTPSPNDSLTSRPSPWPPSPPAREYTPSSCPPHCNLPCPSQTQDTPQWQDTCHPPKTPARRPHPETSGTAACGAWPRRPTARRCRRRRPRRRCRSAGGRPAR